MTVAHVIHSTTPLVLVLDKDRHQALALVEGLTTSDLTVVQADSAVCLSDYSSSEKYKLAAVILDAKIGIDAVQEAVAAINPRFVEDNGPIIILMDEDLVADDPIANIRQCKVIDRRMGLPVLRRFIAEEVERYTIISALRREIENRTSAIGQIVQGVFQFKTRREAHNLATMLSLTCDDPMPVAIGLTELFVNAIEHGCLEIGHDEKGQLLEAGQFAEEVERRQQLPEFCNRFATVDFKREKQALFFVVRDPGPGFDYEIYMSTNGGHGKKHGRGIIMAKGCFSTLSYHGCGNEVRAMHPLNDEQANA